jgi:hypothetical protein
MPVVLTPKKNHILLRIHLAFRKDDFRILLKPKKLSKLGKPSLFDPKDFRYS